VPFRALLDASVLVPAALRDTLLRAAEAYLYQPLWSDVILEETERTVRDVLGVSREDASDLIAAIRDAFPDAIVTGFDALIPSLTVDPKDRHVAAAAVIGHAQALVTLNIRHFPQASLDPYHIEVQSPDAFLLHLFTLDPEDLTDLVRRQAADLDSPPMSALALCDILRATVPEFIALVRTRLLS
jgi:hypothetical protein